MRRPDTARLRNIQGSKQNKELKQTHKVGGKVKKQKPMSAHPSNRRQKRLRKSTSIVSAQEESDGGSASDEMQSIDDVSMGSQQINADILKSDSIEKQDIENLKLNVVSPPNRHVHQPPLASKPKPDSPPRKASEHLTRIDMVEAPRPEGKFLEEIGSVFKTQMDRLKLHEQNRTIINQQIYQKKFGARLNAEEEEHSSSNLNNNLEYSETNQEDSVLLRDPELSIYDQMDLEQACDGWELWRRKKQHPNLVKKYS